jgi:hypothetical protein
MNHRSFLARVALLLVLGSGCAATVGTTSNVYVPPTAAGTCQAQCQGIGLDLGAVVVMANNVGCVCQPRGTSTAKASSAAVAGGMAAIMQAEQQSQQQAAQQQIHH